VVAARGRADGVVELLLVELLAARRVGEHREDPEGALARRVAQGDPLEGAAVVPERGDGGAPEEGGQTAAARAVPKVHERASAPEGRAEELVRGAADDAPGDVHHELVALERRREGAGHGPAASGEAAHRKPEDRRAGRGGRGADEVAAAEVRPDPDLERAPRAWGDLETRGVAARPVEGLEGAAAELVPQPPEAAGVPVEDEVFRGLGEELPVVDGGAEGEEAPALLLGEDDRVLVGLDGEEAASRVPPRGGEVEVRGGADAGHARDQRLGLLGESVERRLLLAVEDAVGRGACDEVVVVADDEPPPRRCEQPGVTARGARS
jgi:hypothetical protein